jgi:hypothetical protein
MPQDNSERRSNPIVGMVARAICTVGLVVAVLAVEIAARHGDTAAAIAMGVVASGCIPLIIWGGPAPRRGHANRYGTEITRLLGGGALFR